MLTTIKITNQMDCNYICQRIHKAIMDYQKDIPDLNDTMVVIDIRKVSQDYNDHIPKLEHKNN